MNYKIFLATTLLSLSTISLCQEKVKLRADSIINNFIEKIGGANWKNLKTRIEKGVVEYHESGEHASIIPKSSTRSTYYKAPFYYLDFKDSFFLEKRILCLRPECNWYYTEKSSMVKFFGSDPIKYRTDFPRTELLEILNLKFKKQVYQVDSLLRVDFKDSRQKDGIQSLYFSIKTGLLVKRSSLSNNDVLWEFYFSNFRENNGLKEAYKIDLFGSGEPYFTISIDSIMYNEELDLSMFDPPVKCRNTDSFEILDNPYYPSFIKE